MSQQFTSLSDPDLASLLIAGAVGVLPTDTVYGLVARANDSRAITKLYRTKQRASQPGTIIAASTEDLVSLGFNETELHKVGQHWPGAISVVLGAENIPSYLKCERTDLAVRIPNNEDLLELLKQTGPLMTTSANAPKQPTAGTLADAQDYFGNSIEFYVEGGDLRGNPPSTIIGFDLTGNIIVHRLGAVDISAV